MDGLVLGCAEGHRFDSNRRGFLSLIDASKGILGDPRELLEARAKFLDLGHYTPIADVVAAAVSASRASSVLDSGSGTGYYLRHVLSHSPGIVNALAVDASSAAVAMSVAATASSGLVADVWGPSPVRDARTDAILCIFAPRNSAEFARALRPDGVLVVVTPASEHLAELRNAGLMIGMQPDKLAKLDESLLGDFSLTSRASLHYEIDLSEAAAADLTSMGPSGHHGRSGRWSGGTATVSVDCSVFTPR